MAVTVTVNHDDLRAKSEPACRALGVARKLAERHRGTTVTVTVTGPVVPARDSREADQLEASGASQAAASEPRLPESRAISRVSTFGSESKSESPLRRPLLSLSIFRL